jgi:hypothetical protein
VFLYGSKAGVGRGARPISGAWSAVFQAFFDAVQAVIDLDHFAG